MMTRCIAGLLLCLSTVPAFADDDPLVHLKKGQPKDIVALIERLVGCNHWSGEEPYDAGRIKEISSALAEMRCSQLTVDERKTSEKYANNAKVLNALKQAKETSW